MSLRHSSRWFVVVSLVLGLACHAQAASVRLIAGLTDAAPGGGVFAGSGFVGAPAAAGNGLVVFRSLIADGAHTERIVLAKMTFGTEDKEPVASVGAPVSGHPDLGTFTGFIGNPGINANGDVVFVATLTNSTLLPDDPDLPAPAALFVYNNATNTLAARVLARDNSAAGPIALAEPFDPEGEIDLEARSPVINDAGDIAFTAATRANATTGGGGVFRLPAVGSLQVVARIGEALGGSTFQSFAQPAINAAGNVAFHGRLSGLGALDGIFRWNAGVLTTIADNGDQVTTAEPAVHDQNLLEFGDEVALRDDDAVVFTGGPLFDFTFVVPPALPDPDEAGFGLLLGTGTGGLSTILYPGQTFPERGRVTDVRLQSEFSADPPGASLAPDGDIIGYAVLNGGSSEVLARVETPGLAPTQVLAFGGTTASPSPTGGTYLTATGTPAVDGVGGIAVVARLAGGPASDALVYDPPSGSSTFVVAGESAIPDGIFAGPAFANPAISDQGDVVVRAFVANGPAGIGLYRYRNGETAPLVRVGDPAPVPGSPPFANIVGEHEVNDSGTVVFSAVAGDLGRGVYTAGSNGVARVAVVGDAGPAGLGNNVSFVSFVGNPAISNDGTVAFRARVQFTQNNVTRRRDGIFVRSGSQVRAIAISGDPSPSTLPFFRFRELSLREGVRVAFTASLGEDEAEVEGLFVGDLQSLGTIALVGQALEGSLTALSGRPTIDSDGAVTILGRVNSGGDHAAVLRGNTAFFEPVVEVGDEGPTGGTIRSIGRPAVSPAGRAAFRTTFEPNSGGVGGFYLLNEAGMAPFVSTGDAAPASIGGRFTSFNQRAALNSDDTLAFIASLSGSDVDNGLFLASPSSFQIKNARIKLGTATRADKLVLQAELDPGGLSEGFIPTQVRLDLTVQDDGSAVWSQQVPEGGLVKKGGKYVFRAPPDVGLIAIKVSKQTQRVKLKVRAQPDFSGGGVFPFEPPARVRLELGDVSGQASVDCVTKGKTLSCK
jgi:hypothetical protein